MASHLVADQRASVFLPTISTTKAADVSRLGPEGYVQVRLASLDRCLVDGQPYLPNLVADSSDLESIKKVACQVLHARSGTTYAISTKPSYLNRLVVSSVSGGITNILFRVSGLQKLDGDDGDNDGDDWNANNHLPDSVLVRVFGGHGMIDRDIENATFSALWKAGFAPTYYGRFANGRLEEYKPYRALVTRELSQKNKSISIMRKMSHLHSHFQIPLHLQSYHNPSKPSMWIQLDKWMSQALACTFQTVHDTERAQGLQLDKIRSELDWLRQVIPVDAPMAFCHNDLLAANMLYDDDGRGDVVLIDFEYGGCNYCAFDIANFFNEFAGGTVDGIPNYEWCPSPQDQAELVGCYLQERENGAVVAEDQVRAWLAAISLFQLANHLYWGLWAVIQAASNGCHEFDYLLYGSCRIKQYYKSKQIQFPGK